MTDRVDMTEDELETRLAQTHCSGRSAGLREAAELLMDKAMKAFERGDDAEAGLLRNLARTLHGRAETEYAVDQKRQRWKSERTGQGGEL